MYYMRDWVLHLHEHEHRDTSQGGQDGIIKEIFKNIGTTNKYFVEFGHYSSTVEGSNTGALRKEQWTGLMMDGGTEIPELNLKKEFITSENIVELFDKYDVPKEVDFVSIDIDSCDLWVLKSILTSNKYRPRVISCEYNSFFKLEESVTLMNNPSLRWGADWRTADVVYGASLAALNKVANASGWTLVAVIERLDAFFVRNDLLEGCKIPELEFFRNRTDIAAHMLPMYPERYSYFQNY